MNRRIASLENTAETDVRFRRQHTTPRRGHDIVPDNSIGQQMAGNLAIQRLFRSGSIQAKLAISQPNDLYEQEANRIADQVVSSPPVGIIHHKCAACEAGGTTCPKCKEEGKLARKEKPGHPPQAPSEIHSQIVGLRGGGQPLPLSVRAFFEPRFGRDFSYVRVHTDRRAEEIAQAIQAKAFTFEDHVVFGAGEFEADSRDGKRLIAHELTHVVQQGGGGSAAVQGKLVSISVYARHGSLQRREMWEVSGSDVDTCTEQIAEDTARCQDHVNTACSGGAAAATGAATLAGAGIGTALTAWLGPTVVPGALVGGGIGLIGGVVSAISLYGKCVEHGNARCRQLGREKTAECKAKWAKTP